ncbi:MAG: flavodoxin domain-containing protein [Candidatus Peribacteraceae bacterium]|jgi:flavodoxin|nr:flavodoxin domain-containing protein [Candidatus Peribacteraceae bacterium]MDP7454550.1 flavodoxin domain-containing protein [Candidatus Peribacteraceae bacterium]MDP7646393.1 flavodoxin domain-containing protein [Candidatus Peribacteraceae bacterium]|tara:strand:- start:813 stop:1277 length:465 start_codon:yes stop_codon:yes gene_type:complete
MKIQIIFTTSTGNTEHVVGVLRKSLESKGISVSSQLAEESKPEDLLKGDILILACGTWNTGGSEGQLHIRMDAFLNSKSKDIDLGGKQVAIISLGDEEYYFTGRATEHLIRFVMEHNGKLIGSPLLIINDPEEQEEKVCKWGERVVELSSACHA